MKILITLMVFLSLSTLAFPATIYVPDNYATIQGAIDASSNGDVVIVRPGTYVENIDFVGKAITVQSEQGAAATVIDGGQAGHVVRFTTGETEDSVLTGFTVTNGYASNGGGIYSRDFSSPTITNNIIHGNHGANGGGVYVTQGSTPTLTNNTIACNTADFGGGICVNGNGHPYVANTILWDDTAPTGPEVHVISGALTLTHCDIEGGTGGWGGGGCIDADPLFVDAANGDLHLSCLSPCYGAGDSDALGLPQEDFEGDPRVIHDNVEIGADEFFCHLYYWGAPVPGNTVNVRVAAVPGQEVTLYRGDDILQNPYWTGHGYLYITWPAAVSWYLGKIPSTGVLRQNVTLPVGWVPGDSYFFQAQVGQWGNTYSWLTNLLTLTVE